MRPIAIGESDFRYLIEKRCLYIDKTLLIKEIIDDPSRVMLITRPRRFGKTLNLNMLKCFFDIEEDESPLIFENLNIWKAGEGYKSKFHQNPVIWLSFKDIHDQSWHKTEENIRFVLSEEYSRHKKIRTLLSDADQIYFDKICARTSSIVELERSLHKLTHLLSVTHKSNVWVLIDEYDVPVQTGYLSGFYDQIIDFMRVFFGAALKDNPYLEKAILTGIIRVTKESIFSGLNNIKVCSILNDQYSNFFGLLEPEVDQLLQEYQLNDSKIQVQEWYDGYQFGNTKGIYNPWSITNYLQQKNFQPYWINTSANELIKEILTKSPTNIKFELQSLINGNGYVHAIEENIGFKDLTINPLSIWSLFLVSGYLKAQTTFSNEFLLEIPNKEIRKEYERIIESWFINKKGIQLSEVLNFMLKGEIDKFAYGFQQLVMESFSSFDVGKDTAENFYHGFVLGMLINLKDRFEITSNRESGLGRYDLCMIPNNNEDSAFLVEFKIFDAKKNKDLEKAASNALAQIDRKKYTTLFKMKRIQKYNIIAIVFKGKNVLIKSKKFTEG